MTEIIRGDHSLLRDPLDQELIRLLRALGHLPPFTDQEIEHAGRKLEEDGLPHLLCSLVTPPPDPFSMTWRSLRTVRNREDQNGEVADLLARAAREGGRMTPEVEARMQQDRQNAEQAQKDDEDDD